MKEIMIWKLKFGPVFILYDILLIRIIHMQMLISILSE